MAKRDRISLPDITAAFSTLADEHAQKREPLAREQAWRLIRSRLATSNDEPWHALPSAWMLRLGLPLAAAAALALGLLALGGNSTLRYEVRGAAPVDGVIHSVEREAIIDFSDGSRVQMKKGSASQIEILGTRAARARLTAGDMEVSVQHERDTDYRFLAGPYEVRVVGTKFHLSWQPSSGSFSVVMHEGRVQVVGPDALNRAVSAGETLRLSRPASEFAGAPTTVRADDARPSGLGTGAQPSGPALDESLPARAAAPAAELADGRGSGALAKADGLSWPALVAKGRFAEVVSAAEAAGSDRALRERGGADLSALAHAAHYTGRTALAVNAWTTLRQRFGGQKASRQAAFFLGRVYDQQGRAGEALRWLNAYLSEAPGDVYASEALGRKLGVVQKVQGSAAARKVAEDYIARFPKGAYAQTARALLSD